MMADSPSSLYSMDGLADLVTRLPESNGEIKGSSDEDTFDIEVLIQKLEAYKASVEDAQAQLRRKRSINPREVSEVTAAARQKLRLDGRPPASSQSHDHSVLTSPLAPTFPSSISSNATSSSKASYFDALPLTPDDHAQIPVAVVAEDTPRDTWKSSHSVVVPSEKGSDCDMPSKFSVPPRSPGIHVPDTKISSSLTNKLPGNKTAVSSPLSSPAFGVTEWLEVRRAIGSLANSDLGEGRKSIDQMSMCPPDEDRIRREIETYTIKDWVDTENVKQLEAIALSKEPVLMPSMNPGGDSDEEDLEQSRKIVQTSEPSASQPGYEYGKTTFREKMGGLWHRRTKTDKIIALYYEMESDPKPKARSWTMRKANSQS